jgi:hypothetical protein
MWARLFPISSVLEECCLLLGRWLTAAVTCIGCCSGAHAGDISTSKYDVLGVVVGMPYEQASAIVRAHNQKFSSYREFQTNDANLETRYAWFIGSHPWFAGGAGSEQSTVDWLSAWLVRDSSQTKVVSIYRRVQVKTTVDDVVSALKLKYGEPEKISSGQSGGAFSSDRFPITSLTWEPVSSTKLPAQLRCKPQSIPSLDMLSLLPTDDTRVKFVRSEFYNSKIEPGCRLFAYALIVASQKDPKWATELRISVVDFEGIRAERARVNRSYEREADRKREEAKQPLPKL